MDINDAIKLVKEQVSNYAYQLSYNKYTNKYSSGNYEYEIDRAEYALRVLAPISNGLGIESYDGELSFYCDYEIYLSWYGFNVKDDEDED
jgi:hypothetical protein